MGICLKNKEYQMDMGYLSFGFLRQTIATVYDDILGNLYERLYSSHSAKDRDLVIDKINEYLNFTNLDDDILEFLFSPDSEGKISYKVCRKLYKIVKSYDNNLRYGYVWANNSFSYFKEMLYNCASKRRNLYWG